MITNTPHATNLTPAERRKQNRLAELLDKAKDHVMTPEEIAAQRKSWVCGEMLLQYPTMTYDEASDRYDAITANPAPAPQVVGSFGVADSRLAYQRDHAPQVMVPEVSSDLPRKHLIRRCVEIADQVVPSFRGKGLCCTGPTAKRWQAAYDGAALALGLNDEEQEPSHD